MSLIPAILVVSVTILIAVIGLFFRFGHLSARVEELERWRTDMRKDMHEISDILESIRLQLKNLETLMLERTDRRPFAHGNGH